MRVTTVTAARKAPGNCEACGKPIEVGQGYKYIKPRYGRRRVRHDGCPGWRPSEMTSSKLAIEEARNVIDGLEL